VPPNQNPLNLLKTPVHAYPAAHASSSTCGSASRVHTRGKSWTPRRRGWRICWVGLAVCKSRRRAQRRRAHGPRATSPRSCMGYGSRVSRPSDPAPRRTRPVLNRLRCTLMRSSDRRAVVPRRIACGPGLYLCPGVQRGGRRSILRYLEGTRTQSIEVSLESTLARRRELRVRVQRTRFSTGRVRRGGGDPMVDSLENQTPYNSEVTLRGGRAPASFAHGASVV
jgi:hypothetical protein